MKTRILRIFFIIITSSLLLLVTTGCDPEIVRQHTAILAVDTARLNDQIEELTKSRQQIELARARLTEIINLETLTTEQKTSVDLGTWSALKDDAAYKQRLQFFENIKSVTNTASIQDDEIEKLNNKITEVSALAKGQRSEQLAETAKDLAALSVKNSLTENLNFLVGYVKTVKVAMDKAKNDSNNASTAADTKSEQLKTDIKSDNFTK